MSDDKPSDRAIAQAFMHEVWNTQVKDGEASRLIDRVLHYAKEIDAQQPIVIVAAQEKDSEHGFRLPYSSPPRSVEKPWAKEGK